MSELAQIQESCSCGASINATGSRYRNDKDSRNPRGVEEIVERWRKDHRCVDLAEVEPDDPAVPLTPTQSPPLARFGIAGVNLKATA